MRCAAGRFETVEAVRPRPQHRSTISPPSGRTRLRRHPRGLPISCRLRRRCLPDRAASGSLSPSAYRRGRVRRPFWRPRGVRGFRPRRNWARRGTTSPARRGLLSGGCRWSQYRGSQHRWRGNGLTLGFFGGGGGETAAGSGGGLVGTGGGALLDGTPFGGTGTAGGSIKMLGMEPVTPGAASPNGSGSSLDSSSPISTGNSSESSSGGGITKFVWAATPGTTRSPLPCGGRCPVARPAAGMRTTGSSSSGAVRWWRSATVRRDGL